MRNHELRCFTCDKRVGAVEDDFEFEAEAVAVCGKCYERFIKISNEFVDVLEEAREDDHDWPGGENILTELREIRGVGDGN